MKALQGTIYPCYNFFLIILLLPFNYSCLNLFYACGLCARKDCILLVETSRDYFANTFYRKLICRPKELPSTQFEFYFCLFMNIQWLTSSCWSFLLPHLSLEKISNLLPIHGGTHAGCFLLLITCD